MLAPPRVAAGEGSADAGAGVESALDEDGLSSSNIDINRMYLVIKSIVNTNHLEEQRDFWWPPTSWTGPFKGQSVVIGL